MPYLNAHAALGPSIPIANKELMPTASSFSGIPGLQNISLEYFFKVSGALLINMFPSVIVKGRSSGPQSRHD